MKSKYEGKDEIDVDIDGEKLHIKLPPRKITVDLVELKYIPYGEKERPVYDSLIDHYIQLLIDFVDTQEKYPFNKFLEEVIGAEATNYDDEDDEEDMYEKRARQEMIRSVRANVHELRDKIPGITRRGLWTLMYDEY